MNVALLLYKKSAQLFKEWDMVMNSYNPYVWNIAEIKFQMTVIFYINDLILFYLNPCITTNYINID